MGWTTTDLSADWSINDGTFDTDHIDAANTTGTTWEVDVVYTGSLDMSNVTKIKVEHNFGATGLDLIAWYGAGIWDDTSNYVSGAEWEWSDKDVNRFLTQGSNSTYEVTKIELYTGDSNSFDMDIPVATADFKGGAHIDADIPSPELLISDGGAVFEGDIPSPSLTMETGGNLDLDIPSATLSAVVIGLNPSDIVATIPPMFLTMESSWSETLDTFDMEIPAMELSMYSSGRVSLNIPEMSLSIEGTTSKVANIKAKIPSLTMVSKSGITGGMTIPVVTLSSSVSTTVPIPDLSGDFALSIPSLRARIVSIPDDTVNADIPMMTMSIECEQSGDNDLNLTIPSLIAAVESGEIAGDVLRYIRGKIR